MAAITRSQKGSSGDGIQGYLASVGQKLMNSGGLGKVVMYAVVLFGYWLYMRFTRSGKTDGDNALPEKPKDPTALQHGMVSLARDKAVHIAKRSAIVPAVVSPPASSSPGAAHQHASEAEGEDTQVTTDSKAATSVVLFFHATGLSGEEHAHVVAKFEKSNVLLIDLPCHGRSTCWLPSGDDWEELEKKIVGADATLFPEGVPKTLVLSGYSPFLTRGMFDAFMPDYVVWTGPNELFSNKDINTVEDLKSKLLSDESTSKKHNEVGREKAFNKLPIGILRDATMHMAHDKRPQYTLERNVTELILQEVIVSPTLVLSSEKPEKFTSLNKKIEAKQHPWELVKSEKWLSTVQQWLEEQADAAGQHKTQEEADHAPAAEPATGSMPDEDLQADDGSTKAGGGADEF